MNEESRIDLRASLLGSYDELRGKLARRLGSAELALDALHETYLALERAGPLEAVRSPKQYLLRIAFNIASRLRRRERATVSLSDAMIAAGLVDEAPDPARAAEARLEVEALERALADLTPRQRQILLDSRLRGIPLREIAARLGLSQRTVEIDLARGLALCSLRLDRDLVRRFGPAKFRDSDQ